MKKILRRTGIALLIFLILDILLLTGLYLFHRFRLRQEAPLRQHTVGTPVNVDGGKMNVYTEGEGPHTFVFMSGFGTASPVYDFKPLYTKLSTDNRIAVVEKFGYGFSDDSGSPRDIKTMLSQTRAALTLPPQARAYRPNLVCWIRMIIKITRATIIITETGISQTFPWPINVYQPGRFATLLDPLTIRLMP